MKKFLKKIILFFLIPLLIPVIVFIVIDPFMLIGENKGRIKLNKKFNITWNRDFQSTELFIKNYKKFKYNSFIMGNSRSFYYNVKIWEKYVQGNCFHFNSSGESIYGIKKK